LTWETASLADGLSLRGDRQEVQAVSYYLYFRLQARDATLALLVAETTLPWQLWHNGRSVSAEAASVLDLEPGSNELLVRVQVPVGAAADTARVALSYRAPQEVEPSMPQQLGLVTLAERLKSAVGADADQVPAEFLDVDWSAAAGQGDAARGRNLFGADALGCVKCHGIVPGQSGAGAPSLAGARERFTVAHLVESVLLPSRQVAPPFRATHIITIDGQVLSGLVVAEEGDAEGGTSGGNQASGAITILLPDATRRIIPLDQIDERRELETSPMPAGVVRTPDELRDLLAYLLSENPQPP
jgi:putative heme-binding domain-containing protein